MTDSTRRPINEVIESSSLGTASAKAARSTISVRRGRAVADRAAKYSSGRISRTSERGDTN